MRLEHVEGLGVVVRRCGWHGVVVAFDVKASSWLDDAMRRRVVDGVVDRSLIRLTSYPPLMADGLDGSIRHRVDDPDLVAWCRLLAFR